MAKTLPFGVITPSAKDALSFPPELDQRIGTLASHACDRADELIMRFEAYEALESLLAGKHDHLNPEHLATLLRGLNEGFVKALDASLAAAQRVKERVQGGRGA